jgi:hypothetical protein
MPALMHPPKELFPVGLAAMKSIALAAGEVRPGARRMIDAAQRLILGSDIDFDALAPITPEVFATEFIAPPEMRQQLIRGMCVLAMADGKPDARVMNAVRRFARAVGVEEPALRPLELFAHGQMLLGTLDYHRRSNLRTMLESEMERGLYAGVKAFLGVRGLSEDPLVAAPFLALGDLPEGTLGRALFEHYRSNGFAFPGEKGGFPESAVYHDLTHVLAGYGTDPFGELQVGAFTSGFRKREPFFVALLPLLVFVAEINVTPIPHGHIDAMFERPGVAEDYIAAIERGSRVKIDLSDHWDFWPMMSLPLDVARARLGISRPS